jgi:16S rRNA (uracil1498-N3)-methyltransferase
MHRFFSPSKNILAKEIIISDRRQVHHFRDVLRLKVKDKVIVCDEAGNEYICLIKEWLNNQARLEIKDKRLFQGKSVKITVACAIPKKSKMDDIVDKLTQLGVDRIIPLETERVIIKLDAYKKISRLKRWQKIAQSASQQSHRCALPVIEPIIDLKKLLSESAEFDLKIIPTLAGPRQALKKILEKYKPKNILILIGPEGDFTQDEVNMAVKAGSIPVSLGDLVLRVDTAAIAVVSFLRLGAPEH